LKLSHNQRQASIVTDAAGCRGIERNTRGFVQLRGCCWAAIAAISGSAISRHGADYARNGDSADPVISGICDIDIALRIESRFLGRNQLCRCRRSPVPAIASACHCANDSGGIDLANATAVEIAGGCMPEGQYSRMSLV
jgi:hypothetical protein